MKKFLFSVLATIIISPMIVSAQEMSTYYTNINGATLTEEQYNRLIQVFDEDTLYTMASETIDMVKDQTNLKVSSTEKYIKVDSYYNRSGDLINQIETEISEENALNPSDTIISTYSWNVTHQTNMKKLNMQVVANGYASSKIVTLTNTWLSIPSTKSYDVIALRPGSNSMTVNVNSSTISGYQKYDGQLINYTSSSSNTKKSSSFTGNGGIGISMNIVDSVSSSLVNSMTVTFISGSSPFNIYGTYQHAQSDVSLSESQNYTFSATGLGGVLNFDTSIKPKYDAMQGVSLSYNFGDELY